MTRQFQILITFLLFFYCTFFSCSNEKKQNQNIERIIISKLDGNKKNSISLQIDLKISDKNSEGTFTFQNISGVVADKEGNIYILDSGQFCIHIFNVSGEYLRSIGGEGQGPGEFKDMADFHINPNGLITIYDFINNRITFLNKEGKFISSKMCEGTIYYSYSIDNDAYIILREAFQKGKDILELVQTKLDKTNELIYDGNFHKLHTTVVNNTEQPLRLGPASICQSNKQGIVAHTTGKKYVIEFYNLDGMKFKEIIWPSYRPLKVTDKDKKDVLQNLIHLPEYFRNNIAFSKTKNIFKALRFDESGNLWAIREMEDNQLFADVFNKNSKYIAEVHIPEMLYSVSYNYAFSIKSYDDAQYVIRYKIRKNQ